MKTAVAQASIDIYHGKVKDFIAPNQKQVIRQKMQFGVAYTRNELGAICGYSQTSAGRAIKELIADGLVDVPGKKVCPISGQRVGAVTLSMAAA